MAKNADMCSRCLVTEPWVRSFIGANLRVWLELCQPQTVEPGVLPAIFNPNNPMSSLAVGELEEGLRPRIAFASLTDAE